MRFCFRLLIVLILLSLAALADDKPKEKFSGYMFGDLYWIAANHNSAIQDRNGFWFRRIYFTYDRELSEAFSMRMRMEYNHPGNFTTSGKAEPFIKDAYLKWKSWQHAIVIGISPTPTWEVVENIWGYRSVEKTPLDLQKFGSSRDFGVAFSGALDSQGKVKYHLLLGNGNGEKSETNKGKKAMLSLGFNPSKEILLEVYGDWNDNPGENDWFTVQGFLAYKTAKGRIGVQFAHQTRKVEGGADVNMEIGSAFVAVKVAEKASMFARVDRMFDPNPAGTGIDYIPFDPSAKSTFAVGGLDISPIPDVHLLPNVEAVFYSENRAGVTPDSDVIPRFTFYYTFK